jgi:hypothetical protein
VAIPPFPRCRREAGQHPATKKTKIFARQLFQRQKSHRSCTMSTKLSRDHVASKSLMATVIQKKEKPKIILNNFEELLVIKKSILFYIKNKCISYGMSLVLMQKRTGHF